MPERKRETAGQQLKEEKQEEGDRRELGWS
jgi:hypothetical protein